MYTPPNMTTETGTAYKSAIDAALASLTGIWGKRRNINGDGLVNQLVSATALSTSFAYTIDMWEAKASVGTVTGNVGQVAATSFPADVAIGSSAISSSTTGTLSFRTKIESRNCADLLAAPFIYGSTGWASGSSQHPYVSLSMLVLHQFGATITVTPVLRSADAQDNFSTMTNSISFAAQNVATGTLTQLVWDTAALAQALDSLTNAANGLCLELQFSVPTGLSAKSLLFGDVQLEGGQVATFYGRSLFVDELVRCQRYFAKTFPYAVAPAQNAAHPLNAMGAPQIVAATTSQVGNPTWKFPVEMIAAPAVTGFNPNAANANPRNVTRANDASSPVLSSDTQAARLTFTTSSGSSVGDQNFIHLTADARL